MRFTLALLTAVVALSAISGCSYRNPTINRIVDPYWKKADFTKDNEWYVRTTVVDAPPDAPYIPIGEGDWLMLEKIRWEITETMLIGWRSYADVPGSDDDNFPGSTDVYKGEPVAMFRIVDHFDIKQDFDPGTGERGNTIVENHDRLWFDRAFMRVDWSVNLVPSFKFNIVLNQSFDTVDVPANNPGDPKRWRFENDDNGNLDYFEVTTRTQLAPDLYTYFGFYGVPYQYDPAGALVSMRHSFMRVPASDYQPLAMPPSVVLEDQNGQEVRDSKGFAVRVPINDRFGYFGTLGRQTFDENRGMVEAGQIFNASRFNIWKHHTKPDGTIIPIDQREPKPIIYYTNVEHPVELNNAAQRVGAEWNRSFRSMIAAAQPAKYHGQKDADGIPSDVPAMFVVKPNDCNFDNVGKVLAALPKDLKAQVETASVRESFNSDVVPFDGTFKNAHDRFVDSQNDNKPNTTFGTREDEENQALNDLERICASLEYFTAGDSTLGIAAPKDDNGNAIPVFKYERAGDTRYSFLNVIVGPFHSDWLGYGPPFSDPITGETISATANIALAELDREIAIAAQFVSVINGEVDPTDFTFGFDIDKYMRQKLVETNALTSLKPSNDAKAQLGAYFDALRAHGDGDVMENAVGEVAPGRTDALAAKIQGTSLEQQLVSTDDLIAVGGLDPTTAANATLDDQLMNAVSPLRGGNMVKKYLDHRDHLVKQMGMRAMDGPEFVDALWLGEALRYRNESYNDRYKHMREDYYVAVTSHEVGHNTGLFHNMAGSADALNYGPTFWEIQKLPADMADAVTALQGKSDSTSTTWTERLNTCVKAVDEIGTDAQNQLDPQAANMTTQDCLEQQESTYSSIMDYHANWMANPEGHVLGNYDLAATKFAYAQLLEVFDNTALASQPADDTTVKRAIFLNGWENIASDTADGRGAHPALMAGSTLDERVANIQNRKYVKMDWNTSSTQFAPPATTVPYKFGQGAGFTPDDKPFDFGPDFRTNAKNELTRYFQGYFFSHFSRDHLSSYFTYPNAVDRAMNSDLGALMDFTEKMQWLFFFEATDPDFKGSHAEDDFLGTAITGLNLFGKVLGTPANGRYVTAEKSDVFGILDEPPENRTQSPSNIAVEWSSLSKCSSRQVAVTGANVPVPQACLVDADCSDPQKGQPGVCTSSGNCICDAAHGMCINTSDPRDGLFVKPQSGYQTSIVPESEGRPFFLGLTNDYEDWYITYVGTFWSKLYAMQLLGFDYAFFPREDFYADPRVYDVSWYRLFPKQVSKLFHSFITNRPQEIGPTIDSNGNFVSRDLLNADLSEPDYSGNTVILPSVSYTQQYASAIWANIWGMSSPTDDTVDLPKTMKVALEGGNDDTSAFDDAIANAQANGVDPATVVATFTHPVSGLTYRGLKVGDFPIAYDLVTQANLLKERFQRLDTCVTDMNLDLTDGVIDGKGLSDPSNPQSAIVPVPNAHQTDPYCACIDNYVDFVSGDCTEQRVDPIGTGLCQPFVLQNRRDSAREIMDDLVDYVGDIRSLNKYLGNY
jgi:hypothetical protein